MIEDAQATIGSSWQNASIVEIVPQTPRIKSFVLRPESPFAYLPGQHIDLRLTAPDGYSALRSYSIASAPERTETIEIAIDRMDDGEVSPFFHDVAEPGDSIELKGPLGGHFVWAEDHGGPVLLIGGGSGLVPLMAMIRHRRARGATVAMALLLSARSWEDVLYRDELFALDGRKDGFRLALTLTRDAIPRDRVRNQRIDAGLIAETVDHLGAPPRLAFICGSNAFVNAAADGAITAGIPVARIKTERYGG